MKRVVVSLCAVTLTLALATLGGVSFAAGAELAEDDAASVFHTPLSPADGSGADDSLSEVANEATLMNSIHVDASERDEPADQSLLASSKANEQQQQQEEEDGRRLRTGRRWYKGQPPTQQTSSVVRNPGAVRSFNSNNNCDKFQGTVDYQSVRNDQFSARNSPGPRKVNINVVNQGLTYTLYTVDADAVVFFDDGDDSTQVGSFMETVPMGKTYYGVGDCRPRVSGGGNRQLRWRSNVRSNNNNVGNVRSNNNNNFYAGTIECNMYLCQPIGSVRNVGNPQNGQVASQDATNILLVAEEDSPSSSSD